VNLSYHEDSLHWMWLDLQTILCQGVNYNANVFRGRKRFVSEGDGGKVKPWVSVVLVLGGQYCIPQLTAEYHYIPSSVWLNVVRDCSMLTVFETFYDTLLEYIAILPWRGTFVILWFDWCWLITTVVQCSAEILLLSFYTVSQKTRLQTLARNFTKY